MEEEEKEEEKQRKKERKDMIMTVEERAWKPIGIIKWPSLSNSQYMNFWKGNTKNCLQIFKYKWFFIELLPVI